MNEMGWDQDVLDDLNYYLGTNNTGGFMVLYKGRRIVEQYYGLWTRWTTYPMFSCEKSLLAFIAGQFIHDQRIDIDGYVSDYIGDYWSNTNNANQLAVEAPITIRHLLTSTSGLSEAGLVGMGEGGLIYEYDPNTEWHYNSATFNLLKKVLMTLDNLDPEDKDDIKDFYDAYVGDDIGMSSNTGFLDSVDYVKFTTRDMALFGHMILAGGYWTNHYLLYDSTYIHDMVNTSQNYNEAYGYLWWLNGKDSYIAACPVDEDTLDLNSLGTGELLSGSSFLRDWLLHLILDNTDGETIAEIQEAIADSEGGTITGSMIPNAPDRMVMANGFGDKCIYIVPDEHIVVVRHGPMSSIVEQVTTGYDFDIGLWGYLNDLIGLTPPSATTAATAAATPDATKGMIAFPNPATDQVSLQCDMPKAGNATVAIYNMNGEVIARVNDSIASAGVHTFVWQCADIAPGIYMAQVKLENELIDSCKVAIKR